MNHPKKIAILGGSGRTGHYLVNQLLDQGFHVRCLIRTPEKLEIKNPLLEVIQGNALDPLAVDDLIKDCQAVISTIGQRKGEPLVSAASTQLVLQSMNNHQVKRYMAVTGVSIDVPGDKKSFKTKFSSSLMRWMFPAVVADKQHAWSILTDSTINWTLIRVPVIAYTVERHPIEISLEDCRGKKISTMDLSYFLIEQLWDNTYSAKAPFISNV